MRAEENGPRAVGVFAEEIEAAGPLTRDAFRAAAARTRDKTGLKGRALFHPIRVALTGARRQEDQGEDRDEECEGASHAPRLAPGTAQPKGGRADDRARVPFTRGHENGVEGEPRWEASTRSS